MTGQEQCIVEYCDAFKEKAAPDGARGVETGDKQAVKEIYVSGEKKEV